VAGQLRAEIARILRAEITDPRLRGVTLTRVEVSADLGVARVFWSHLEAEDPEVTRTVASALQHAASFVRRRLAAALPLRRTPRVDFIHDPSLVLGARTLATMQALHDDETE
jgi:ribosome-binding factor A